VAIKPQVSRTLEGAKPKQYARVCVQIAGWRQGYGLRPLWRIYSLIVVALNIWVGDICKTRSYNVWIAGYCNIFIYKLFSNNPFNTN
jgi:hypothetical protein